MVFLVFLVQLLLVSPQLMPAITSLNVHDEAKYIESGRILLQGELRDLSWGPLVAFVYAPAHLLVGNVPNWFILETWIGRFVLFAFLWLSVFYLARQLKQFFPPPVMLGILFVTTAFFPILENQSDAVFGGFSALALAKCLAYYHHRRIRDLWLAGFFVGLGVFARVETVLLVGILAILAAILARRRSIWMNLAAAVLPALALMGLFVLANLVTQGHPNLGVGAKSYDSFEWNQSILTGGDLVKARQEAQRLFGTQEENQGSVLRAILRNPPAFGLRILANLKTLPNAYLAFFGKLLGPALLFFAAWGVYALLRRRAYAVLGILLFWPLHALFALGFLARHVVPQVVYLPLILAAIGIAAALRPGSHRAERLLFLLAAILLVVYSALDHKPAFLYAGLMLAAVFALAWLLWRHDSARSQSWTAPFWLLLAAGLVLHGSYPFPNYAVIGQTNEELAIDYLQDTLRASQSILVPNPLPALASKLNAVELADAPQGVASAQDLWTWLKQEGIHAAYLDSRYGIRQDLFPLFEAGAGQFFTLAFTSPDGSLRIFLVEQK